MSLIDLALDAAMLKHLSEINQHVKLLTASASGGEQDGIDSVNVSIQNLSEKIDTLNNALVQETENRVAVTIQNSDGAIHELVSRVVEEVLVRVKQENILRVTNG